MRIEALKLARQITLSSFRSLDAEVSVLCLPCVCCVLRLRECCFYFNKVTKALRVQCKAGRTKAGHRRACWKQYCTQKCCHLLQLWSTATPKLTKAKARNRDTRIAGFRGENFDQPCLQASEERDCSRSGKALLEEKGLPNTAYLYWWRSKAFFLLSLVWCAG